MASSSRFLSPRSWPIAVKMSIDLLLAALVPLLAAVWLTSSRSREHLQSEALDNLTLLAEVNATRIDQLLVDTQRTLGIAVGDELVQMYCTAEPEERERLSDSIHRRLGLIRESSPEFAAIYLIDSTGICRASTDRAFINNNYMFREYTREALAGRDYVSNLLIGSTSRDPGVYFSAPIRAPGSVDGPIIGVAALKLDGRSVWRIVDSAHVGERGHAMLSDKHGVIIAHPDRTRLFHTFVPLSSDEIAAIDPKKSWNVETIESIDAPALAPMLRNAGAMGSGEFLLPVEGAASESHQPPEPWIIGYSPMTRQGWLVSVMQPEAEFLDPINDQMRQNLWIMLAVALAAAGLAIWRARSVVRPVLAVTQAANQLASGDFDARAPHLAHDEIGRLADAFNKMVPQLKERVDLQQSLAVAMQVQQSLLPEGDPKPPGLDVAGRSKYCDATGGDYYDFIDISRVSTSSTLIALGDVMGHGIASALLMATARAALRAQALEGCALTPLMSKVNRVLAADNRHNRFMTMALVVIDPKQGSVRWASAGHDPTLTYHTDEDRFVELEGGDVPLGIDPTIVYEEFSYSGLKPGDVLVIGTDGIWEMRSATGELFGKDRLRDIMKRDARKSAADIAKAIQDELTTFRGVVLPQDDVTFVVVRIATPAAA